MYIGTETEVIYSCRDCDCSETKPGKPARREECSIPLKTLMYDGCKSRVAMATADTREKYNLRMKFLMLKAALGMK